MDLSSGLGLGLGLEALRMDLSLVCDVLWLERRIPNRSGYHEHPVDSLRAVLQGTVRVRDSFELGFELWLGLWLELGLGLVQLGLGLVQPSHPGLLALH